jgi:hypothetical protein
MTTIVVALVVMGVVGWLASIVIGESRFRRGRSAGLAVLSMWCFNGLLWVAFGLALLS